MVRGLFPDVIGWALVADAAARLDVGFAAVAATVVVLARESYAPWALGPRR